MSKFILLAVLFALCLNEIYADNHATDGAKSDTKENVEKDAKSTAPEESKTGQEQDIYDKAGSCPHRFHMGCLLDVVEKSCTGLQALEACANNGKCKNMDELGRIVSALNPKNFEAVNKCCCSKANKEGGYENCKTPDAVCKKAVDSHVNTKDLKDNLKLMSVCLKKKKQSDCKKALGAANWVLEALQKARGEMWPTEGCQILAPPEPLSKCGLDLKPEPRAIERADLYCDTIIWQFKEMGASDPFMSKCKDAPKMPAQLATAADGEDGEGEDGGEVDDYGGGEEPEVIEDEEESEESEYPDGDGMEGETESDEENQDGEGYKPQELFGDEDPYAEEPQYFKDEL